MNAILVGTDRGLRVLAGDGPEQIPDRTVSFLAHDLDSGPDDGGRRWWAILDDSEIWAGRRGWESEGSLSGLRARCLLPVPAEPGLLVGTSEARVLASLDPLPSFDAVPGREDWFTPWGGPPDTRSMSRGPDGVIYVNVHVGGIPRSTDGGASWEPTIDVNSDVHQVLAHPERPGRVLAACAYGLAESRDAGATWTIGDDGLHASYSRAVALAGDTVLMTASTSHRGEHAAVYRRPLDADGPFERCAEGLPESFRGNIDTHWLAADETRAAFAAPDGSVYISEDAGATWDELAAGLEGVRCLALA